MLTKGINFKNFKTKLINKKVKFNLKSILVEKNEVIKSLGINYQNQFDKNLIKKFKKKNNFRLIGMGGSILGSQTIYDFLNYKIKKNFLFIDNLNPHPTKNSKKNFVNLIVSKSGNTIETIVNSNILIKKR